MWSNVTPQKHCAGRSRRGSDCPERGGLPPDDGLSVIARGGLLRYRSMLARLPGHKRPSPIKVVLDEFLTDHGRFLDHGLGKSGSYVVLGSRAAVGTQAGDPVAPGNEGSGPLPSSLRKVVPLGGTRRPAGGDPATVAPSDHWERGSEPCPVRGTPERATDSGPVAPDSVGGDRVGVGRPAEPVAKDRWCGGGRSAPVRRRWASGG